MPAVRICTLTVDQRTINALHSATRALAERGNSLLKTTFKALRRVTLCPWRIGTITAAALVLFAPRAPPNYMINPLLGKAQHPLAGRRQSSDGFTVECGPRSNCAADQCRRHLTCPRCASPCRVFTAVRVNHVCDRWIMRRSVRHSPVSAWFSSYRYCDVSIPTAALDRPASIRDVSPVRTRPRHRRDHGRDHNCIELGRPAVRICRGPPSDTVTQVSQLVSHLFSQVRPTRST
jgi:hypothetical protein